MGYTGRSGVDTYRDKGGGEIVPCGSSQAAWGFCCGKTVSFPRWTKFGEKMSNVTYTGPDRASPPRGPAPAYNRYARKYSRARSKRYARVLDILISRGV